MFRDITGAVKKAESHRLSLREAPLRWGDDAIQPLDRLGALSLSKRLDRHARRRRARDDNSGESR
jgi:hypothetical protein